MNVCVVTEVVVIVWELEVRLVLDLIRLRGLQKARTAELGSDLLFRLVIA